MKKILIGALGAVGAAMGITATVLHMGWVDVAADTPHSHAVYRLLAFAREQSIERRARDIVPPADLSAADRVRRGAGNYDAMCVGCHLAPGVGNSEIRRGLNPTPPDLTRANRSTDPQRTVARQFWVIKHGVKATGMAAWSQGGMEDAAIWDLVAFLQGLPDLSPAAYRQLVAASEGHSHGGADHHTAHEVRERGCADAHAVAEKPSHRHGHGDHGH